MRRNTRFLLPLFVLLPFAALALSDEPTTAT